MLVRLAKLFKDYCGVLNEEAIRKNFALIYEILDDAMVNLLLLLLLLLSLSSSDS
jgi:hypothetical protein